MNKKAIILINTGTPDSPDVKSVKKYLKEFLSDGRVINMPYLIRKFLVNFIIVPFRVKNSAKLYSLIWNENDSPLLYHSLNLRDKIKQLFDDYEVHIAMRYGNPSLKKLLNKFNDDNYSELIFVPLYPQYASSTTGSVIDLIYSEMKHRDIIPAIKIIGQFYSKPEFISAFVNNIRQYDIEKYEHVIFSFHGLPVSHIDKIHPGIIYTNCNCEKEFPGNSNYCYKATCYETARLIAQECGFSKDSYSVAFQSRLTKNWLSPFTDKLIIEKAKSGIKNILIVSPSFVADCLETLVELEIEYTKVFKENGGNELTLVHSLNDSALWVDALKKIISGY